MEKTQKTTKKAVRTAAPASARPARVRKEKAGAVVSHAVGRRKTAVARVWLRKGNGTFKVNGKDAMTYFDTDIARQDAHYPLTILPLSVGYDIDANVYGGGFCAQAGAVRLGIARAFVASDESLKAILKEHKLLTVDSRVKERKKYGQKAARRKFQFVKR